MSVELTEAPFQVDLNQCVKLETALAYNETEIVETIPVVPLVKSDLPEWLEKIRQKQIGYNKRFEKAHEALFDAFQDFISEIDSINNQFKTDFDLADVCRDFEGKELVDYKA